MRYGAGHRAATRQRIVASAARRFRLESYEAASLAEIMQDAGLTVGGFYAHFASKEELFAEAITFAGEEALAARSDIAAGSASWLSAFVANYLNQEHREDRAGGCPLAALGADVARAGVLPQASYRDSARYFAATLADHIDGPEAQRRQLAQAVTAMCVGALTLARAGLDPPSADALFDACARAAEALVRATEGHAG